VTLSFHAARFLPRDKGAAPLDIVIGIMAFLAALALGASLLTARVAGGWQKGLADHLTVQIVPTFGTDTGQLLPREAAAALTVLRATPGIARAEELSDAQTASLIEPWLGKNAIMPELPIPRLIDAVIVPGGEIDVSALAGRLKREAPHAVLDDHSRWIGRLKDLARTMILSAYGVMFLIAVAMAATVAFATRAGLEAHHEKVELLHQMGAHSGFIARAFEWHYLVSAFAAGACGAGLAAIMFVIAGVLAYVGVQPVAFLPSLVLRPSELLWIALIPVAAATISLITTRLSVLTVLRAIY
jgi:cell division transport system permease protein